MILQAIIDHLKEQGITVYDFGVGFHIKANRQPTTIATIDLNDPESLDKITKIIHQLT